MSSPAPSAEQGTDHEVSNSGATGLTKDQIVAAALRLTEFNGVREAVLGFLRRAEGEASVPLAEAMVAFKAPACEMFDPADLEIVRAAVASENREAIDLLLTVLAAKTNSNNPQSPQLIFDSLPKQAQLEMVLKEAQKIVTRFGDAQVLANWYAGMPKDQYTWVSMQTPQFQLFYSILTDKAHPEWKGQVLKVLGLESPKLAEDLN